MMEAGEIAVLAAAAVNSIYDLRKREILLIPTLFFAGSGILYGLMRGQQLPHLLFGALPGALLAALSSASRGAVGFGDAVIVAAAGIWSGAHAAWTALFLAFGIQAAASVIYRIAGGRRRELPFVPALLAGYLLQIICFS